MKYHKINHSGMEMYLIYFLFILGSCRGKENTSDKPKIDPEAIILTKEQLGLLEINMVKPEYDALPSIIQLNGKVKALPNLNASISSNIDGKIDKVFVRDGDYVYKGQPILSMISMELIELQNQYLESKSAVDFLKVEFDRQEELRKSNVGALSEFQTVESKYKAAISKEKSLSAKLEILGIDTRGLSDPKNPQIKTSLAIKAPIAGYLNRLNVNIGMLVTSTSIFGEIVDVNELFAEIYVYEKDINMISEGQKVEITFPNSKVTSAKGEIFNIDRAIDQNTRTITLHVKFKVPEKSLILPGMNVIAAVSNDGEANKGFLVPNSSVLKEEDYSYVFTAKGKDSTMCFRKEKVIVGNKTDKMCEVSFPNAKEKEIFIAGSNVMAIEMERKKVALGEQAE